MAVSWSLKQHQRCLSLSLASRWFRIRRSALNKKYQNDNKGEGFVANDPLLSSAARSAFDLAEAYADESNVAV